MITDTANLTTYGFFIDGQVQAVGARQVFPTVNPYSQKPWAMLVQATPEDIDAAVAAAQRAFKGVWRSTNGSTRATLMGKLADLLDSNAARLATLETTDNGKTLTESTNNIKAAAKYLRFFAGFADKVYGSVIPMDNLSLLDFTLREPIGVIAIMTPWNSPISILANSLAPALAAGNTAVIKPSEFTSVTSIEFAKLAKEAGFPDGVINVVTGDYRVGDYLSRKRGIGKISFTGGSSTGRIIARNAGENLIPLVLELGGKSPNIIFADADIEKACVNAARGVFGGAGQTCIAGSRLLVERPVYDQVVQRVTEIAQAMRLGDPFDAKTQMGPVASRAQYDRILSMIETARAEGARVTAGGGPAHLEASPQGLFVQPTVLVDVNNAMTIAREEVFGPVISIIPFEGEAEAIAIANDSEFGLAAGIWTRDISRAHRIVREVESGQVWVNTYRVSGAHVPFGGVKQSGYGRVRGAESLHEFTQVKNVMIDIS